MLKSPKINTKTFFEDAKKNISLSDERKALLSSIASKIVDEYNDRDRLNLNFICTHNSRRSQMGQVWTFFAVEYFGLENIFSYSGGTEVTAFHRNTVKSLQTVGFEFNVLDFSHQNPKYLITFDGTDKTILGFSKIYDNAENVYPYIAITTCDSADQNCPFIPDAIHRFHLPFVDPKHSDGSDQMIETYLKTSEQIAGEIYTIFEEVATALK